jgi:L-alanine-DL-glutamate epimerase-like enolase superfamily enzyme
MMTRRQFLKYSASVAAGAVLPRLAAAAEPIRLKSWELVEVPVASKKPNAMLKLIATNGAVGYASAATKDYTAAAHVVQGANLLDHEPLHDLLLAKRVPKVQVAAFDIAAWDLHARMLGKPLHALLGTKRTKVLRYGDVRGLQPNFSPQNYARSAARMLEQSGMLATKLHFPGAMGTSDSISFPVLLETLQAVRQAVGKDPILAYDPCARGMAESATNSVDEAKQILKLMDALGYSWIEGPLPPVPYETQIPKYVELMKTGTKQRIQAEGAGSPIGDETPFEDMKRWAEAGAITQWSTDAQWSTGVTNCLRCLEYSRLHPPLVINLHYSQPPHVHLAMAYDDTVFPIGEFPGKGPWLLAPDWPGIYRIE